MESEKAIKRAERFGLSHPALEEQKRQERAARFGIVVPLKEEVKLEARKERFKPLSGSKTAATTAVSAEFEAKKKVRACYRRDAEEDLSHNEGGWAMVIVFLNHTGV